MSIGTRKRPNPNQPKSLLRQAHDALCARLGIDILEQHNIEYRLPADLTLKELLHLYAGLLLNSLTIAFFIGCAALFYFRIDDDNELPATLALLFALLSAGLGLYLKRLRK